MKKDSLSDERLVSLHQQKRINAFFIIYARYKTYGFAIIYRALAEHNLVNALLDEKDAILYDSIVEAIDHFDRKRGTFRKLVSTIITNRTINHINHFKLDAMSDYVSLDANYSDGYLFRYSDSSVYADKFADQTGSPREVINTNERNEKIAINYTGIYKRKVRKMMNLREHGYTYKEIAKKFDTTERAVSAIFYRIKKRINVNDNNKIKK